MSTTDVSRPVNRGVPVGNVPADAGTGCLRPSEPAIARAGTIRKKRPTSIDMPWVVLYQSVLPVSPPKADPLLFAGETKPWTITLSPCGPGLAIELNAVFRTTEMPAKARITTGTNRV